MRNAAEVRAEVRGTRRSGVQRHADQTGKVVMRNAAEVRAEVRGTRCSGVQRHADQIKES